MLHWLVDQAFEDLLAQWRAWHAVTTRTTSTVPERAEARKQLDVARNRMHRLRKALYPNADEAEAVVDKVWCDRLETIVQLSWVERSRRFPGNFECPCGDLIAIDWSRLTPP